MNQDDRNGIEDPAVSGPLTQEGIVLETIGDQAGARRSRRTFRFAIMACLALTFALWFSERYLRLDMIESQYRMALTLPDDSARAILRNVVRRDALRTDTPSAKYVEALAAIEEDDLVLPRYEEAYKLNPGNASLILNFGCRLFLAGQYKEARERFRESGIQPPRNALPRYLEAAALAASASLDDDLSEALALVARTNNSGDPILFPKPLWHNTLPARGECYSRMRREIADRCCAPLYRLDGLLIRKARADINAGDLHDWDSWLEKMQEMGARLVGDAQSDPANIGASQAIAGAHIQWSAIQLREQIHEQEAGKPDAALIQQRVKLENALDLLKNFENTRGARIEAHRELVKKPLRLSAGTLGIFFGVYLLVMLLSRALQCRRLYWTTPHTSMAKTVLSIGLTLMTCLLMILGFVAQANETAPVLSSFVTGCWYSVAAGLIIAGLIYPFTALPRPVDSAQQETPKQRRMAAVTLMRRYFGILFGGYLAALCLWLLLYRIMSGLFPVQLPLLVTGLENEELDIVRRVQEILAASAGAGGL